VLAVLPNWAIELGRLHCCAICALLHFCWFQRRWALEDPRLSDRWPCVESPCGATPDPLDPAPLPPRLPSVAAPSTASRPATAPGDQVGAGAAGFSRFRPVTATPGRLRWTIDQRQALPRRTKQKTR